MTNWDFLVLPVLKGSLGLTSSLALIGLLPNCWFGQVLGLVRVLAPGSGRHSRLPPERDVGSTPAPQRPRQEGQGAAGKGQGGVSFILSYSDSACWTLSVPLAAQRRLILFLNCHRLNNVKLPPIYLSKTVSSLGKRIAGTRNAPWSLGPCSYNFTITTTQALELTIEANNPVRPSNLMLP